MKTLFGHSRPSNAVARGSSSHWKPPAIKYNHKNQYNQKKRINKAALGGPSAGGFISFQGKHTAQEEELAASYVKRFAELTIKKRWFIKKQGSTHTGWKPKFLQRVWKPAILELMQMVPPAELERVFGWYMHHAGLKHVPFCVSLKSFCEAYVEVKEAVIRAGELPPEEEYDGWWVKDKDGNRVFDPTKKGNQWELDDEYHDEVLREHGIKPLSAKERAKQQAAWEEEWFPKDNKGKS